MAQFTEEDFKQFAEVNPGAMNQFSLIRMARENAEKDKEIKKLKDKYEPSKKKSK